MIEYWSNWNFVWFMLYRLNYIKFTPSLKLSIICTSILGAYISHFTEKFYIYVNINMPYLNRLRIEIPYHYRFIGDMVLHQYPLYYILTTNGEITKDCGAYIAIPTTIWMSLNLLRRVPLDDIYNVNMTKKMILPSILIWSCIGINHHCFGRSSLK
jgi:hypothetical protein